MKSIQLFAIALLSFFVNSVNAQIYDTIPMIADTGYIYDEEMPPRVEAIEGVDYGDYGEYTVEAAPEEVELLLFNEFNTKTIAKLEANPDKAARYPGGFGAMNSELQENLNLPYNYSSKAKYVIVQVTVGKDSILYNPKILHTEGSEYTRNAKEAIQSLSKRFIPATKAGKPVDSILLIPVRFETATKRTNIH